MDNNTPPGQDLPVVARAVAASIGSLTEQVATLTTRIEIHRRYLVIVTACLIMSGVLTAAIVYLGFSVRSTSNCQARQNDAFTAAVTQLAEAGATERAAQRVLLETSLDPAATIEQRQEATRRYLGELSAADAHRADTVFPIKNCA